MTATTSLLGLALPVTGDLDGTWGTTVNDSITSLLDSAVAGTTSLSTDGDITLSSTALVANEARQPILLCSGARTALRTITAPAQSKYYIVINNTTGGYGVKVVGVGPTTGVTIANGENALIAWNGTDFEVVTTNYINLNFVTGTLAATNGGTGFSSYAVGDLVYASGTTALSKLTIGSANYILTSSGTAPQWVQFMSPAQGGTGVANNAANTITFTGAYSLGLTLTAVTAVTLPTTGTLATLAGTETFTNKRINPRVSSAASASSLTPDIASFDQYAYTALAANLTINAPTGTPTDGNKLLIRILDNGTARTLTWNATYTAIGVVLPTSTTANKTTYVGCVYNANNTRWDVIAVTTQA